MSRILLTFVGSHDLFRNREENGAGPIEQLIRYLKPTEIFIFLSSEYKNEFIEKDLEIKYKNITDGNLTIIDTNIENPTNCEEIVGKISKNIDEINNMILENKWQGFINMTSGTPVIISVLSLFVITGQLNRTFGMYAPNPKFDTQIKMTALDFYKNSFAYKTLKDMINLMDYIAIDEFLKKNKKIFIKLEENEEFKNIVKFAKYRITSDYVKANELSEQCDYLKEYKFKLPVNLYDKALELYFSAKMAERNADYFQAVLKAGIVRENLNSFIVNNLLKEHDIDIIEYKKKNNNGKEIKIPYFKTENIDKYLDLFNHINCKLNSSETGVKKLDTTREITDFTLELIFDYFYRTKQSSYIDNIAKNFKKIEKLKAERNNLAHTIAPPIYNSVWLDSIKEILVSTAEHLKFDIPDFDIYKNINNKLLEILKNTLNN